jgi:serine/threonine protein kinase
MVDTNKNLIRRHLRGKKQIDSLLGAIDIIEEIGEGGNAIVYNAKFGIKEIALKLLAEDVQSNSSKYKRFITEFKEIIQLTETQAVVPIYYYGHLSVEELQFPYILMKKYPYTLKKWTNQNQITTFNELKPVLSPLFRVVSVIHHRGIVHRDLKPENILVDKDDNMVLADFGISWFDPELYERHVHTKKDDRMANINFSAPEQFQKGSTPHPTMDIFALGQLITWLITGDVTRGDRIPLNSINESFGVIEPIVRKMLSRNPQDRPQSIEEVVSELKENINEKSKQNDRNKEISFVTKNLEIFNDVLRFCFPGKRRTFEITDNLKFDRLLTQLNEVSDKIQLWWTQGSSNMPIEKFEKLNDKTWLIDYTEIQIEKIWVTKDNYSYDHQYIILKTKAMANFDVYDEQNAMYREEAAWFMDRYITREEYDDGVADINGESVWLEGKAELRVRNLQPQYYFIATNSHPILLDENDSIVSRIYEKLIEFDTLEDEDIKILGKLGRHRISIMLS